MTRFLATIEIPVNITVEAPNIDVATEMADDIFAIVYAIAEEAVAKAPLPEGVGFGNRYDDTEIEEVNA